MTRIELKAWAADRHAALLRRETPDAEADATLVEACGTAESILRRASPGTPCVEPLGWSDIISVLLPILLAWLDRRFPRATPTATPTPTPFPPLVEE